MGVMRYLLSFFLFVLAFVCVAGGGFQQALAQDVLSVRVGQHPDKFRLVIDLSQATDFRAFTLGQPDRIVVDLPQFGWKAAGRVDLPTVSGMKSVRHGVLNSGVSRIVFDMAMPVQIKSAFLLPAGNGKANRLVVDFVRNAANLPQKEVFGTLETGAVPWGGDLAVNAQDSQSAMGSPVPPQRAAPAKKPIVVIDAGHGGQDPGATSGSYHEKNITMALARALKQDLEATGRFEVHLTRGSDHYIKLYDRVKIARGHNADLFISLHADSIGKSDVRGASVYTLSEKASDAQTAKLAARENKADLIAGIDLSHEDADVAGILLDLVQRDTMNQSNYFAEKIVKHFASSGIKTLENPHRSAGFAVLKSPDTPSVLVEAGFISNRQDAQLLSTQAYQNKVAHSISEAVQSYFERVGGLGGS